MVMKIKPSIYTLGLPVADWTRCKGEKNHSEWIMRNYAWFIALLCKSVIMSWNIFGNPLVPYWKMKYERKLLKAELWHSPVENTGRSVCVGGGRWSAKKRGPHRKHIWSQWPLGNWFQQFLVVSVDLRELVHKNIWRRILSFPSLFHFGWETNLEAFAIYT